MTPVRRLLCAAAAALALAAVQPGTAAQPPEDGSAAVLREAGVRFPQRVGPFVLQRVGSLGPDRANAHYEAEGDPGGPIVFDVYVGSTNVTPAAELADTEPMVASLIQELQAVRTLAAPAGAPGAAGKLWKGQIRGAPVYTAMMISRRGTWRIKLRATAGASMGDKGIAMIEQAFRDDPWWSAR